MIRKLLITTALAALGAPAAYAAAPVTTICTAKDAAGNVLACTPVISLLADGTVNTGGSGGTTAATIADGAAVNLGSLADTAWTSGSGTLTALGKATVNGLTTINTTLGSLFQAGGSIGNTAFGISGTLPAFAATPTVNLGTLNGAATLAKQDTLIALLPSSLGPKTGAGSLSFTPASDATFGLAASELHAGEFGGNGITVQVAQTVTASSAYTAGNAVGGLMTIANAGRVAGKGGIIQSVVIGSKSAQSSQVDVFIFAGNPTASTCTDKTAFALASADFDKVLGVASVSAASWYSGGTASIGQAVNLALPYTPTTATTIYACAVARGTPTFSSTSDVSIAFRAIRD